MSRIVGEGSRWDFGLHLAKLQCSLLVLPEEDLPALTLST